MPKKPRSKLHFPTKHSEGCGVASIKGKTKKKISEYNKNYWNENKQIIITKRKFENKIRNLQIENENKIRTLQIENDNLQNKLDENISNLQKTSILYENEFVSLQEDNDDTDNNDSLDLTYQFKDDEQNSHSYFKYTFDEISHFIQLSLYVPISNISIIQSIFKQKSNNNIKNDNMPSSSQISLWRKLYVPRFNDIFLAYQFSSGYLLDNNNTLCRDGSSIDGQNIESIVAVICQSNPNDQNDNNNFTHIIIGIPNITSKHGRVIADAVLKISNKIDNVQKCM